MSVRVVSGLLSTIMTVMKLLLVLVINIAILTIVVVSLIVLVGFLIILPLRITLSMRVRTAHLTHFDLVSGLFAVDTVDWVISLCF